MEIFTQYLSTIDDQEHRNRVLEVLHWVSSSFPNLLPRIAWNQPMFTDHGTFIIGFSMSKGHMAVSPERAGMVRFEQEIAQSGYAQSQMLFRIPWDKQVDYALLERIIGFNMIDKQMCATFWRKIEE